MPYIGKSPSGLGVRTRYLYTATASQTTFSGADTQNLTLSYSDSNFIDVHQNGVLLKIVDDYTATSGTSVVLGTGATADDVIEITVYDIFSVANHVKKSGDIMTGSLDLNGSELILDADGDTSITADTDDQIDIKVGGTDRVKIESDGDVTITGTGTNAVQGPTLNLFRDSSSPADSDDLGTISFKGKNSADETVTYAEITAETRDVTNGTEDGYIDFNIPIAGTMYNVFEIGTQEVVVNESSVDVDFRVESNNNSVMLYVDAGNDHVNIGTITDHGGVLNVQSTDNGATLTLVSTDDDAETGPNLHLTRNSASPADDDLIGRIIFNGQNDAGEEVEFANINARIRDASDGTETGRVVFQTTFEGGTGFNRLDFDNNETVINETGANLDFRVEGDADTDLFFVDAGNDAVCFNSTTLGANSKVTINGIKNGTFGRTCFRLRDTDSNVDSGNTMMVCDFSGDGTATNGTYISFRDSGGEIGKINCAGGSSVSFNTTSDYRIKENIKPMTDAWDKIKAIKLVNFTWKTHKTEPAQDGVIAHELQEIFPQAVSGYKDEMVTREDGTKDMELQGVDYGKLSTLLAKGLQEAMAKIETLEAKVTALESK